MKIGIVGLGKMGGNMATRLRQRGHEVVGYDHAAGVTEVPSLRDLVDALPTPRVVWLMVPSGEPTEATLRELTPILSGGDVVVDGGNSDFRDSIRRGEALAEQDVGFLDAGVSGGVWGLEEGYCLMVGGSERDVDVVRPVFEALAPPDGFAHVGRSGAGHFTKMVHNGVEYGLMESYAEGYELLAASDLEVDVPAALGAWRYGSVVRSWLLELLVRALEDDPALEAIEGYAVDSGEGRWTVREALNLAVPVPAISSALYARFVSRQDDSPAMKVVAALRNQFGGHAVRSSGS